MYKRKNRKKGMTSFMRLSLACLKQAVEIIGELVKTVKRRDYELQCDRICGHWLGLDRDCSVTIIKENEGYLISFFHNGYLDEQLRTITSGKGIQVNNPTEPTQDLSVHLFDGSNRLIIEGYGTYIRDHIIGYISSNDKKFSIKKRTKYKQ